MGFALSAIGLGLIVFGLIEAQQYGWWNAISDFHGWSHPSAPPGLSVVPVAIFIGAVLLLLLSGGRADSPPVAPPP